MTHEDACKILDISFEANLDDARQAYRNLLREYHPDKNPDIVDDRLKRELTQKKMLIEDAWECLQKTIPERQAKKKEEQERKTEEQQRKAEEEQQRKAAEEAWRKAEEGRQRKAAQEARRKAEEERQRKAEEEQQRKAAEEAWRKAEEERQRKAAQEARRKAEEERQRKAAEEAWRKAEEERQRKAAQEAKRKAEEERQRKAAWKRMVDKVAEHGRRKRRRKALAAVRKWVAVAAAVIGIGYIIADISGMFGDKGATITATVPSPRPRAFSSPSLTKEIDLSAMPNRIKNQLVDKEEIALLPVVPTVSPSNMAIDDPSMPFPNMPLSNAPKTIEQSPPSLPRRSPADSSLEEKMPALGADRPFTESEVRYCIFEKERLTYLQAMTTLLSFHPQYSYMHPKLWMDYKDRAADYVARCVNTRYSHDPDIVKKVEAEAALNRAKLRSEADRIFVRWLNQP